MGAYRRVNFSATERRELWERWRRGESLSQIGRALGRHAATVYSVVLDSGGYSPHVPRRRASHLSFEEREQISRGVARGDSIRSMARMLGRSPSTVSREIQRHGGVQRYRAVRADKQAYRNACRPKQCLLRRRKKLCRLVAMLLRKDWSPEQISGWLKEEFPSDLTMQVSHETIYRTLFVQTRGALKRELLSHLRTRRKARQSRHFNTRGGQRGRIIDPTPIHERPPEANDRAVPGHWEGDLIAGSGNTHVATLVERQSRFTMLVKVAGKDTDSVVRALERQVQRLPRELRRSLTWDRGMELAKHKQFTVATDVVVYFCDPQSPWQRGTNENTNGLLRQYLPKKTDLSVYSQRELNQIAHRLNTRPRKTLEFKSPAEKLNEVLH